MLYTCFSKIFTEETQTRSTESEGGVSVRLVSPGVPNYHVLLEAAVAHFASRTAPLVSAMWTDPPQIEDGGVMHLSAT